jgi:catechol 2,3-dioxygenase-like lactoylglutathione lyase family enzyme
VPAKRKSAPLEFNHAMVYVRELAPTLHFYVDLLGFKLIEQFATAYARLRSPRGQTTLALHLLEPGKTLTGAGGVRLYFETKDLDKTCEILEAAGVVFTQPPKMMPWGWKHAYLNNPDGHEVSLYSAGGKRFQKTTMPKRLPSR